MKSGKAASLSGLMVEKMKAVDDTGQNTAKRFFDLFFKISNSALPGKTLNCVIVASNFKSYYQTQHIP